MSLPRWKRWLRVGLLILVAIAGLGYLSNAMTARASEQMTKVWVRRTMSEWQNNWPGRSSTTEPAQSWIPWFQSVQYHWAVSGTGAEWGTRYYFTFFGLPIVGWHRVWMLA